MDTIDALELAWSQGAALVADLTEAELAATSPCAGWDVDALLDHTIVECAMFTRVNHGEPAHIEGESLDRTDIPGAWAAAASANVASWRDQGVEGDRTYPFGTFPAEASLVINLGEVVVHAWDLAQATGRPFELDPGLVSIVHDFYGSLDMTPYRSYHVFGSEVGVDADAPELDRLVALLGRTP
jgi:uncharacterized protein (TIGR03086 family)